jgi:sugar phosphate isomerase/epimerase
LAEALELLAAPARQAGVTLAVKPMHPVAAAGCSFVSRLGEAVELVEGFDDPAVRLALDLWHWADDPEVGRLLPRLAERTAVIQVADRTGAAGATEDRLPAGHGRLPLAEVVADLAGQGYRGELEFDPVGETVEILGYDGVLAETRLVAASWAGRMVAEVESGTGPGGAGPAYFRGAGSRRSQASSQTVSPG